MILKGKNYTKFALTLSIILLILWAVLGTGTSLAWFTDTTPTDKNSFNIGELNLVISKRLDDGSYKVIDADTSVFDDNALYEPGYTQVVVLKVENKGNIKFDYKTAVTVAGYNTVSNALGGTFSLKDHLKFGVVTADTYAELQIKIKDRHTANNYSALEVPLDTYYTDINSLEVNAEDFIAIIVRMPESESNKVNFRGNTVPKVELGIDITASQHGTLQ